MYTDHMDKMSKESKTLFIRNLPWSVGNNELEGHFSEYGPIKRCFVVQDNVTGKSRGLGYVTYTLREDATKAHNQNHKLEGRPVFVTYADITRKVKKAKRKKPTEVETKSDSEAESEDGDGFEVEKSEPEKLEEKLKDSSVTDGSPEEKKTSLKYHKAKIVLLSGLPDGATDDTLAGCLQKLNVKSVAEYKVLGNKQAHVKFKCIRDAKKAIRKLHNHTYSDCMLQASQLSNPSKGSNSNLPESDQKQNRVIVRNLAFKCKEENLQKAFGKCGSITEVKLPTNTEGKSLGFGFVQFTLVSEAAKAIEVVNATKIMGRPVAVDWAIPKKKFQLIHNKGEQDVSEEEGDDEDEEDSDSDSDNETTAEKTSNKNKAKGSVEEESDDSSSESDGEEEKKGPDKVQSEEDDTDSDDGSSSKEENEQEEEDDDNEDDDEDDDDDEDLASKKKKSRKEGTDKSDCDEGQTVFIRNLAFSCDEKTLDEYFRQFGELVYAKVVVDRDTEHSRGMGFVKFKTKESADKCLGKSESTGMVLQGRVLNVTLAVSRGKAAGFKQTEKKERKDTRNLHLAREGMIRPGTQDAIGLSKDDLDKRMKVESTKRQKLKNINVFISPLRLCVRNIPINVDEKQLKKAFHDAAGQKAAKVTECRIMRDRERVNTEGVAKSMGFGFVSFAEHQHALTALRTTNNNPETFGDKRRLIVEFSLENKKALEAKEKRQARFKAKQEQFKKKPGETGSPEKKKRKRNKPGKSPNVASLQLSQEDRKAKGDKPLTKGLPSHWGPKVRHKPRPGQQKPGKKAFQGRDKPIRQPQQPKPFNKPFNKRPADSQPEGPSMKKRKRGGKQEHDNFDKLVNKYKSRMTDRTKWFDK